MRHYTSDVPQDTLTAQIPDSRSIFINGFPGFNYIVGALNSRICALKPRTKLRLKFVRGLSAGRQLEARQPCTPFPFREYVLSGI
jgi:hypothetical protein